ncbi:TldD/PmbA family protein [Aquabacterium sp. CECT 9606]|uniref:TldD/PmbA family protein n=1 Tax=Aquabacterium sp. CECT 9606 TaxID=2845822 RepID=UPI001E6057FA|nr:TldD/PmbA family protein [Aquabacterium sp. CECT 9606]CAH0348217.1 Metalloprotease TldD [Aquabacterium sp. CECT 9606]
MLDQLSTHAHQAAPAGIDHWAVRGVSERSQRLLVRQDIAQSPAVARDEGAMVTVIAGRGLGYAGTSDTSVAGLKAAFARARDLAQATTGHTVFDPSQLRMPRPQGRYDSVVAQDSGQMSLADKIDLLRAASAATRVDERIVDWQASLWTVQVDQLHLTSDGAHAEQHWQMLTPSIQATAQFQGVTQTRSSAGQYNGFCQQGGLEVIDRSGFRTDGPRVAQQAIELTLAPTCPSGPMDLVLMPDQMMLQIHESIGHPLELDRILGDERNFAGTSFVTLDMFGHYRYGSDLLNVSHDPHQAHEFAGFAFDDDGTGAQRQRIIERGILKQPLGGTISQSRARALGFELGGLATTRASSWNRAPIDRMSNLNVEPGDASLAQIIASVDQGVLMHTNCSWSIDDSRNKFQFGCEYGQMIRHGQLAEVVRNPNYRGVSATFWRSLAMVGDASTFQVMGTPFCGKGEPSQIIRVGHAAPVCKFTNVAVFGGA